MSDFKIGDEVITRDGLWWHNADVGGRLGKVVDIKGHILVDLYDFDDNPIKCFRNEVRKPGYQDRLSKDEVDNFLDEFFDEYQ